MAWTAPADAVVGDVITASFWNTYSRDNLNALRAASIQWEAEFRAAR